MMSSPIQIPKTPPSKPRYGDRFTPNRARNKWSLFSGSPSTPRSSLDSQPLSSKDINDPAETKSPVYSCLLQNEVLGYEIEECKEMTPEKRKTPARRLFHFDSNEKSSTTSLLNSPWSPYSISPISKHSERLLQRSSRKAHRRISKVPFKVLDAPELRDDFYLNLVDWSSQNCIAVGLGTCVYLWSATNAQVTNLCDLNQTRDSVTSVSWNDRANLLAVGTQSGYVQIWDVAAGKQISSINGHAARVGTLSWNGDLICSGSKDQHIRVKDSRTDSLLQERRLIGHKQEICGLKWSPDRQLLASGGNDNRLHIWNLHSTTPIQAYKDHTAAVKAIAWSPHQHGLLASGGGTADKTVRFWNTVTSQAMQCLNTHSQVCNIIWSRHSQEFLTTHGYSQNQISIWKYPSLQRVTELTGHSNRVLYLAMSPDGENIVTGAGDETLRFWNVFKKSKSQKENLRSTLNLYDKIK